MTSSLNLATVFVSKLETALEFYANTLGFKNNLDDRPWQRQRALVPGEHEPEVPPELPPGAEVSPVGTDIVIALRVDEAHVGNGRKITRDSPTLVRLLAVLGLHTDDLHAKCRDFQERGVEFCWGPELDSYYGPSGGQLRIRAAILDLDGNIIWLEEQLEKGDPGPVELQRWVQHPPLY